MWHPGGLSFCRFRIGKGRCCHLMGCIQERRKLGQENFGLTIGKERRAKTCWTKNADRMDSDCCQPLV